MFDDLENESVLPLIRYAPAKLTLTLEILDKREDGYNDLSAFTVFLPEVSDILALEASIHIDNEILVTSNVGDHLAKGKNNLVNKALELFTDHERIDTDFLKSVSLSVEKSIPVAAGLGGGSADAAVTLRALNTLCSEQLTISELIFLGAELGSDVPACIYSQALTMRGRGELIDVVDDFEIGDLHALVITPKITCSTKKVYAHYDEIGRPKCEGSKSPKELEKYIPLMLNDLSLATYDLYPELANVKERLESLTGMTIYLAGSGSTLYALGTLNELNEAEQKVKQDKIFETLRLCAISSIV